jgi:hypothetical protein
MVLGHYKVTVVSLAIQHSYCVSGIFKADETPSETVSIYYSAPPPIFSVCYTSIPPVILSPAPPMSEGSGLEDP